MFAFAIEQERGGRGYKFVPFAYGTNIYGTVFMEFELNRIGLKRIGMNHTKLHPTQNCLD